MNGVMNEVWIDIAPGVHRRTIAAGKQMHQIYVRLDAGSTVPEHRHVNEQIAFCVSGNLKLTVNGVLHDLKPGQCAMIPGNVPHDARVEVDTIVIDTFAPPREDMLRQDAALKAR
jgi:quercetin dioxygenase-like cupin family protein